MLMAEAMLSAMPPTVGMLPASDVGTGTTAAAAVASLRPQRGCRTTTAQAMTVPAPTARGWPMDRLE